MRRQVKWQYPVYTDTHDPATAALNAWIRTQAVRLLLDPLPLAGQALHLTDRELIARAAVDPDFVDSGVDQAVWLPGVALGRYRGIDGYSQYIGGSHPVHSVRTLLYDMGRREERAVGDLFKPDAQDTLSSSVTDQLSPRSACERQNRRRPAAIARAPRAVQAAGCTRAANSNTGCVATMHGSTTWPRPTSRISRRSRRSALLTAFARRVRRANTPRMRR